MRRRTIFRPSASAGFALRRLPFIFAMLLLSAVRSDAAETRRTTLWIDARGEWTDAARWSDGVPDAMSRVAVQGASEVRIPALPHPAAVGTMKLGTLAGDRVRLLISGGELVARRDFLHAGEADGSVAEIVVESGALHGVSALYLGGSGEARPGACRASLRIRGGTFLSRFVSVGFGQRSEAEMAIEGSRADAVRLLDALALGVPIAGREPSRSALAFTLDAHGVTPIAILARRTGLTIHRKAAGQRCALRVALSDVPPRGDVTLIAARAPAVGVFDDLPEGGEIAAEYAGRTYRWTLTYRGGASRCDVTLTAVRGHAADAPVTRVRTFAPTLAPLWEKLPARADAEPPDAPLAFEGAEGFGRHAAGGRGGRTLWVENLDDDGPGSFRAAAAERGPRTIRFRVAGTIALRSALTIATPWLTVDGASAPPGGVTFTGHGLTVQTHDVVLRHFRVRPGDTTEDTDALSFHDAERCIADHLSLSWGTDEVASITGLSDAITVQWCAIAEGLNRSQHGYASIAAGERVTWRHNLFAHHVSRVPRFAGIAQTDFRHNVLYNWGHTAGYGQFERVNYVGNHLRPGPSTTQRPPLFHRGDETVGDATLYLDGNTMHGAPEVTRDNWLGVGFEPRVRAAQPFPAPPVTAQSATEAWESVLAGAGAFTPRRDATDERIVRETRVGGGRIIERTSDIRP